MSTRIPYLSSVFLAILGAAQAGNLEFVAKPTAVKDGDGAVIRFAVNTPTDVEVAVLGADGRVIRHLAAGLLGKNAPEPLQQELLRQALRWDGKDDAGRNAAGGPFRIRVRLGLGAEFDRLLGENEHTLKRLARLASQEQGLALQMGGYGGLFHEGLKPFFDEKDGYSSKEYAGRIGPVADIAVDRVRDQVYVGRQDYYRIEGRTGKIEKLRYGKRFFTQGSIMAVSPDGETICIRARFVIIRLDRNFKPLPFSGPRYNGAWVQTKPERKGSYLKGPNNEGDWLYVFKPTGEPVVGKPVTVLYKDTDPPTGVYRDRITVQPHELLTGPGVTHLQDKGMCIAQNGDIYLLEEDRSWPHGRYYLTVFASDGTTRFRQDFTTTGQTCSLRVDLHGNIFVADCLRPEKQKLPEDVVARLAPDRIARAEPWLWGIYGSVIKFPAIRFPGQPPLIEHAAGGGDSLVLPEGATGRILRGVEPRTFPGEEPVNSPGDLAALSGKKMPWLVRGARWMHYGISPVPAREEGLYKCMCNTPRFDVDLYGRVFYPDMMRHRLVVLDSAGNETTAVGRADWHTRVQDGRLARGDLPLACGMFVAASEEAAYVGDSLGGCVARARFVYGAEELCAIE